MNAKRLVALYPDITSILDTLDRPMMRSRRKGSYLLTDHRHKRIIMGRLANQTLREIGIELSITRERVRQLEHLACNRLRYFILRDQSSRRSKLNG